jgi:hypothetical protein
MEISGTSFRLGIAIATFIAGSATSDAGDIKRGLRSDEIVLEGQIERGDCAKLGNFAYKEGARRVYLASPGGNLLEAMEVGRLVRALKFETIVPGKLRDDLEKKRADQHQLQNYKANFMCASACFFAFVSGISRVSDLGDPLLGIHRPYLSESDLKGMSGDQAIASAGKIRSIVEAYLKEMSVPAKYAEEMFFVRNGEVRWLNSDEFEADLEGIIPELKDWIEARGKVALDELEGLRLQNMPKALLDEREQSLSDTIKRKKTVLDEQ